MCMCLPPLCLFHAFIKKQKHTLKHIILIARIHIYIHMLNINMNTIFNIDTINYHHYCIRWCDGLGNSLLTAPLDVCYWRAPTDNDKGGGPDVSYAGRWNQYGLHDTHREVRVLCGVV